MSIFDFFKIKRKSMNEISMNNKSKSQSVVETEVDIGRWLAEEDYLGMAAQAKRNAEAAVKDKNYDKAWALLHEQKDFYMKHANRSGFSVIQVLALDSTVHESLANILRLEGKHEDAFTHLLYCVISHKHRPIKRHSQKLVAYFNRCKFKYIKITDVTEFIAMGDWEAPDFITAKNKVVTMRQFEHQSMHE